jgi:hypothetical protein
VRLSEDPAKLASVRDNIFPVARAVVTDWDAFPWHRNTRTGEIDADVPWSSQALCMSVWGTVTAPEGAEVRKLVGRAAPHAELARVLADRVLRVALERIDGDLLNEKGSGNPTNLDVVVETGSDAVVIESKLSEPLGGCSQPPKQCSGTYGPGSDLKWRTPAPCRLAIPDGRRTARAYWTVMDTLAGGSFTAPGSPCPFRGPGYQVMRTIASAFRLGERRGKDWRVVFAFPFTLGGSTPADVAAVRDRLLPEHRSRIGLLDYDALAAALLSGESAVARDLGRHMATRIAAARTK